MSGSNSAGVKRNLTFFGFFAMTASMVMAMYEYPSFATSQFAVVFFVLLGGIFWFLPTALVSAELASVDGWSEGGVFGWVGNALHSDKLGFMALFFQWFQITVGFVTMCYFVIGMLADIFGWSEMNSVPWVKFLFVILLFLLINLCQLGGTKYTANIAKWGFLIGILLTSIIFFIVAITYLAQGNPVQIKFGASQFFPNFSNVGTLTIFATFILAFEGVEASGSHIDELDNPNRNYPLVMLIIVILAIILDALGGLAVACVIPQQQLSLNSGIFQTLQFLMYHFSPTLTWFIDIMSVLIVVGVVAEIGSWVVGPSTGMRDSAEYGMMPQWIAKTNKHGVPVNMLIIQFVVFIMWDAILTFGGSGGNVSFLVATTLTTLIYLVCYLLMYVSYFKLIFAGKNLKRSYNVPGGIVVKTIVAVCGTLTSLFAFCMSFTPSTALSGNQTTIFLVLLIICFIISIIIPVIITAFHKQYVKGIPADQLRLIHYKLVEKEQEAKVKSAVN
ncbi:MAG: amino acid permease [Aeriscardovia sp.]|nr:amino acid permease [Aeriscardovia sp.]